MTKMYSFFSVGRVASQQQKEKKNTRKCYLFFSKTKMYLSITNLNEIPKPLLNKTMEIHLPKDSWIGKLLVDELRKEDPHLVMVEYKKMKGVNDCNFCNKLAVPNLLEWDLLETLNMLDYLEPFIIQDLIKEPCLRQLAETIGNYCTFLFVQLDHMNKCGDLQCLSTIKPFYYFHSVQEMKDGIDSVLKWFKALREKCNYRHTLSRWVWNKVYDDMKAEHDKCQNHMDNEEEWRKHMYILDALKRFHCTSDSDGE